jgi:Fe-S cluster biogenesis protein NfuA
MAKILTEQIQDAVLALRPMLEKDGGDLEFVSFDDQTVFIKLKGACTRCPFSFITVQLGLFEALKQQFSMIQSIEVVE